jgi:deazaflavin-dependent oxidoreductase (nitroreductase family)
MGKVMARVLLGLVVVVAGAAAVFVLGMRTGNPTVVDGVRRFNKRVTNPRQLASAGTPGVAAGVIHHVGRTSGRPYETPVSPTPTEDGFVVLLPYGTRADWVRNVLAAGSATLDHDGRTFEVDQPSLTPTADVAHHLSAGDQRAARAFAVKQCLVLHRVDPAPAAAA